jgi:hypothetical protein
VFRETALEWLGDFGLLSIDEEPLPNPTTEQPVPIIFPVPEPQQSKSSPQPTRTQNGPPAPTSAPTINPAVSWAPPTSVKSELVGSDDLVLEDAPPLVAVGDAMYNVQWEQPYLLFIYRIVI